MEIISGLAGGIRLDVPRGGEVRPTAVRARKSLFDSLGSFEGLNAAPTSTCIEFSMFEKRTHGLEVFYYFAVGFSTQVI